MDARVPKAHAAEGRSKVQERGPTITPVSHSPVHARPTRPIDHLQRTAGNSATARLLRAHVIQPKLTVNRPDDEYEREADRVAAQVMRMPDPVAVRVQDAGLGVQRRCAECEEELHRKPPVAASPLSTPISRMCTTCENHSRGEDGELVVQTKRALPDPPRVSAALASYISGGRGAGEPLLDAARSYFEPRFGYDFSRVRIHTDVAAAASARALAARAYTVGEHLFFAAGQYAPASPDGRELLAHELTHVVQQGAAGRTTRGGGHLTSAAAGSASVSMRRMNRQATIQKWSEPRIMRARLFASTIQICRRLLKSRTFTVRKGGLTVTANARWEASSDWRGAEPPECGNPVYHITLSDKGLIWDSEYGTCEFSQGRPVTRAWGGLPSKEYYLTIWTNNTNPNCCLEGSIEVSEDSGIDDAGCTELPPGPLEILHTALDLAGLIPVLGAVPDAINAGIYVVEGDWVGAGLSAAAMIPVVGEGATIAKLGARTVVRVPGRNITRLGKERIALGLREAKASARAVVRNIPHGFTERQFERFSRGARRLRRQANLPDGELVVHGSRVSGTPRTASDIDVALRVDEATFFELSERVLARARPGTRLRETMLDRIRRNGQLSSFDLGTEFQTLRRELLDAESPVTVQFSVLKKGGRLDTGPFLPLE